MKGSPYPIFWVIFRTLILPFFIRMAGFYFLLFYLFFGMVPGGSLISYHKALIMGCLSDFRLFILTLILWFLYYARFYFFSIKALKRPENEFLMTLFPVFDRIFLLQNLFLGVFLACSPIWVYSLFIIALAIEHQFWAQCLILLGYQVGFFFMISYLLSRKYEVSGYAQGIKEKINIFFLSPPKRVPYLSLYYVVFQKTSAFFVGKSISILLVLSSTFISNHFGYDLRVPVLFWIISLSLQTLLVKEISLFDVQEMEFIRNWPYSLGKQWVFKMETMTLFILPEILIFWIYPVKTLYPLSPIWLILLGIGTLLCFYSQIYIPQFVRDNTLTPIFILFVVLFLMNLYTLYIPMIILSWALSSSIFFTGYKGFEWKVLK